MNHAPRSDDRSAPPADDLDATLDTDVAAFIGASLAPVSPPPASRARILDRLMAAVEAEARTSAAPGPATAEPSTGPTPHDGADADADREVVHTVRADDASWTPLGPDASLRVLHDDGRFRSLLVRLGAGARLPPHVHLGDEECYVVDGDIWLSGVHLFRGDFQLAGPGHDHVDIRSDGGCLLHVRTRSEPQPA